MNTQYFFFSVPSVSKSLLIVLGTFPWQCPQVRHYSQEQPLHIKLASQNALASSAYVLRTCRPSSDMRSPWLFYFRLRAKNARERKAFLQMVGAFSSCWPPCAPFVRRCSSPALRRALRSRTDSARDRIRVTQRNTRKGDS